MIGALIIVFREVIEAGLIVGIVLAATRSVAGSRWWISSGVLAGVLGSCLVAAFTGSLAQAFNGFGQEIFNAAILAIAVIMLTWHNLWMARHGRALAGELKQAGREVLEGKKPLLALAIVVGAAVLREGSEVVLFLYGVAISDGGSAASIVSGGFAGLALGALVTGLTYLGLLNIPTRHLFTVTSWLIAFLAAGMAAQSASFLEQAGLVEFLGSTVWNTSGILSEKSIPGRVLHTLIGYSDQPTILQFVVYLATLTAIFVLTKLASKPRLAPA
ncbi:MAG: FTR1 family protein [Aestuariivirga sp.]